MSVPEPPKEEGIIFCGYINLNEIELEEMNMEKIINEAMFDAAVKKAFEKIQGREEFKDAHNGILMFLLDGGIMAGLIKTNLFGNEDEVQAAAAEREDDTKRPGEKEHLTFGQAMEAVKRGRRISRAGWDEHDAYVIMGHDLYFRTGENWPGEYNVVKSDDKIFIFNGRRGPRLGWLPNMEDLLASDWYILPKE
jgi:hypothetical protein